VLRARACGDRRALSPVTRLRDYLSRACRCVDTLLERVAEGSAEVMVATHNQHSIEHTVARMAELSLEPPGEQVRYRVLT